MAPGDDPGSVVGEEQGDRRHGIVTLGIGNDSPQRIQRRSAVRGG